MTIVEEHHSTDRLLRLVVIREDDGDVSIGFDGCSWHTHGDILAAEAGKPEIEAIREFIDRILRDRQLLAVSRIAGEVRDVWPSDDPDGESRHRDANESIEFRRWSGAPVMDL